jgi:hypothetical protein
LGAIPPLRAFGDPAVEVGAELLLDVARKRALVRVARRAQKIFEVLGDELAKVRSLRTARGIAPRVGSERVAEHERGSLGSARVRHTSWPSASGAPSLVPNGAAEKRPRGAPS